MAAHRRTDSADGYAFRSPYSQASHEDHRPIPGPGGAAPTEYGIRSTPAAAMYNSSNIDDGYDYDDGAYGAARAGARAGGATAHSKERADLYTNTLTHAGEDDYPTRLAGGPGGGGATTTGTGLEAGAAAYGRKGIWTPADRASFQRRSTPIKLLRTLLCIVLVGLLIAISAVLLIITFARPPNIAIGAISSNQTTPTLGPTSLSFNTSIDISVSNPNAISATITSLEATAYDSVRPNTAVGSGSIADVRIPTKANTTFTLPFVVKYDSTQDGDSVLIRDIATKCGWISGTSASQLDFTFKINAHLSVLSLAIPISFSVSPRFTCPISRSAIASLLGSTGGSIDDVLRALGIGARRRDGLIDEPSELSERGRDLLIGASGKALTLRDVRFAQLLEDWRQQQQRRALDGTTLSSSSTLKTDL